MQRVSGLNIDFSIEFLCPSFLTDHFTAQSAAGIEKNRFWDCSLWLCAGFGTMRITLHFTACSQSGFEATSEETQQPEAEANAATDTSEASLCYPSWQQTAAQSKSWWKPDRFSTHRVVWKCVTTEDLRDNLKKLLISENAREEETKVLFCGSMLSFYICFVKLICWANIAQDT